MELLATSDLHSRLDWWNWLRAQAPAYDAALIAGDLIEEPNPKNDIDRVRRHCVEINNTCKAISNTTPLYACEGNHDETAKTWLPWLQAQLGRHHFHTCLIDCLPSKITPGVTEAHLLKSQEIARVQGLKWIVLEHYPPVTSKTFGGGDNFLLAKSTIDFGPNILMSGHIHDAPFQPGGSWHHTIGKTLCLNPGCVWAAKTPCHIIIDTTARTATWKAPNQTTTVPLP